MKILKLVIVGTVAALASAMHPINSQVVDAIKERTDLWEAHEPETNPLKDKTVEELLGLCGTFNVESNDSYPFNEVTAVPTNFDARTQWPKFVHAVRDQQSCGSCWAFGASEALSDRFAIASNGAVNVVLSPEDMVSCDTGDMGCNGGYMNKAWSYLEQKGIVTESCFPYSAGSGRAPACKNTCSDGKSFQKYKCKSGSIVHPRTPDQIKSELYNHGPMEGAFTVYQDFFNYKSGVYHHVQGGVAGGHAIKVLGYGTLNGVDYWLCANSWGTSWGENGFFKIKQGDCGINDQMFACTPELSGHAQ